MTTDALQGVGVAILLAYDGWPVVGPGPHLRCTDDGTKAYVSAVGFEYAKALAVLEEVKTTTLRDADLHGNYVRNFLTVNLHPTLTVTRRPS